jgi:threonine dehydratase
VIVMPRFTPGVKVERTRGGAEVVLHGDTLEEAPARLPLAEQQG